MIESYEDVQQELSRLFYHKGVKLGFDVLEPFKAFDYSEVKLIHPKDMRLLLDYFVEDAVKHQIREGMPIDFNIVRNSIGNLQRALETNNLRLNTFSRIRLYNACPYC
tara:strand:+ start:1922 stop:2245 length:324 start_codon:yes stop_codon:yes gene_type:complete